MYIRSRKRLSENISNNIPQYPLVNRHFSQTIKNLLTSQKSLRALLEIPLIRLLGTGSSSIQNFENYLQEKSFTNINAPLRRLRANLIEYPAVLAELETAKRLLDEGMTDISFINQQDSHPDIRFSDHGVVRYAEVKDLMTINPEFAYLHDKLEAVSLTEKKFKRSFIIECEYSVHKFNSVQTLHNDLRKSVDMLIKQLRPLIRNNNLDHHKVTISNFIYTVTTKTAHRVDFMLLFSGGGMYYGQPQDVFLDFANTYSRLLTEIKKGYMQLLLQRSNDKDATKNDRLYIYLNIRRNSFSGNNIKKIFTKLAKAVGALDLIKLKIEY